MAAPPNSVLSKNCHGIWRSALFKLIWIAIKYVSAHYSESPLAQTRQDKTILVLKQDTRVTRKFQVFLVICYSYNISGWIGNQTYNLALQNDLPWETHPPSGGYFQGHPWENPTPPQIILDLWTNRDLQMQYCEDQESNKYEEYFLENFCLNSCHLARTCCKTGTGGLWVDTMFTSAATSPEGLSSSW